MSVKRYEFHADTNTLIYMFKGLECGNPLLSTRPARFFNFYSRYL